MTFENNEFIHLRFNGARKEPMVRHDKVYRFSGNMADATTASNRAALDSPKYRELNRLTLFRVLMEQGINGVEESDGGARVANSRRYVGGVATYLTAEVMPAMIGALSEEVIRMVGGIQYIEGGHWHIQEDVVYDERRVREAVDITLAREEFGALAEVARAHRERLFGDSGPKLDQIQN